MNWQPGRLVLQTVWKRVEPDRPWITFNRRCNFKYTQTYFITTCIAVQLTSPFRVHFNSGAGLFWRFRLIVCILRQAQGLAARAVTLSKVEGCILSKVEG